MMYLREPGGWRAASSLSKKARNFAAKTYALRLSFWSQEKITGKGKTTGHNDVGRQLKKFLQ